MEMGAVLLEKIGSISRLQGNVETGIDPVEEKTSVVIL